VSVFSKPGFNAGVKHNEAVIKGNGTAAGVVKAVVDQAGQLLVGGVGAEGEGPRYTETGGVEERGSIRGGSGEEDGRDASGDGGGDWGGNGHGEANVASRVEKAGTGLSNGGGGGSEPGGSVRGIFRVGG